MNPKVLIVFDLNGTLACTSNIRHKKGVILRPHIKHLTKLFELNRFEIAIFSSAMEHNVNKIVKEIESKINHKFHYVLHREHTILSPTITNQYRTKKPLQKNFPNHNINNIILVDDSNHKSLENEYKNLLQVPTWHGDEKDNLLQKLTTRLLKVKSIKNIPKIISRLH